VRESACRRSPSAHAGTKLRASACLRIARHNKASQRFSDVRTSWYMAGLSNANFVQEILSCIHSFTLGPSVLTILYTLSRDYLVLQNDFAPLTFPAALSCAVEKSSSKLFGLVLHIVFPGRNCILRSQTNCFRLPFTLYRKPQTRYYVPLRKQSIPSYQFHPKLWTSSQKLLAPGHWRHSPSQPRRNI
jgi:hypothetical protein